MVIPVIPDAFVGLVSPVVPAELHSADFLAS